MPVPGEEEQAAAMATVAAILVLVSLAAVASAVMSRRTALRARERLDELTGHDALTGLPNRTVFEADLQRALDGKSGQRRKFTLMLFELNRYGAVNETYGHETGDKLMSTVMRQVATAFHEGEQLYRYSGPQFAAICPGLTTVDEARQRANDIQASLRVPFRVARDSIRLNASIGFTVTDTSVGNWRDAMLDAVIALQEANERGTGTIVNFEIALRSKLNPITAERRLKEALEHGQFWLLYMPVVSVADDQIVGVEALLRWMDPDRGLIAPGEFLRALDDTGLIIPVGTWVLEEAARQTRVWADKFPDHDLTTTINVSPRQLVQSDFPDILSAAIHSSGIQATRLCLEIPEMSMFGQVEGAWRTLRDVKDMGTQLALDDFGTGYSSLSYVRQFQLDVLKIEPSFVQNLGTSREDEALVGQIIGLAHNLGITAVAEGVEGELQAETLKSLNCDLAQGYYYSQPQPVDVIDKMLAKGKVKPSEGRRAEIDWSGGGVPVSRDILSK